MSNNLHDLLKKDTRNFKKKNYPKSSDSSRVVHHLKTKLNFQALQV